MSSRTSTSTSQRRSRAPRRTFPVEGLEVERVKDDIKPMLNEEENEVCFRVLLDNNYFSSVSETIIADYENGLRGVYDAFIRCIWREGDLVIVKAITRSFNSENRANVDRWTPGLKRLYKSTSIKELKHIQGVVISVADGGSLIVAGRGYTETLIVPSRDYNALVVNDGQDIYPENRDLSVAFEAAECNYANFDNIASGQISQLETERRVFRSSDLRYVANLGGMLINVFVYKGNIYISNSSNISIFGEKAEWNGQKHSSIMERFGLNEYNVADVFGQLFRNEEERSLVYSFYVTDVHYCHRSKVVVNAFTLNSKQELVEAYPPYIYPRRFYLSDIIRGRESIFDDKNYRNLYLDVITRLNDAADIINAGDRDKFVFAIFENLLTSDIIGAEKRINFFRYKAATNYDNMWFNIMRKEEIAPGTGIFRYVTYNVCNLSGLEDYNSWNESISDSLAIRLAEQARLLQEGRLPILNTSLNNQTSVFGATRYILLTLGLVDQKDPKKPFNLTPYKISGNLKDRMNRPGGEKNFIVNGRVIVMNRPWKLEVVKTTSIEEFIEKDMQDQQTTSVSNGTPFVYNPSRVNGTINNIMLSNAVVKTLNANVHPEIHHIMICKMLEEYNNLVKNFIKIFDEAVNKLKGFASAGKGKKGKLNSNWLRRWIAENGYSMDTNNHNFLIKVLLDAIYLILLNDENPSTYDHNLLIHYKGTRTDDQRYAAIENNMYNYISPVYVTKIGRHYAKDNSVDSFLGMLRPYFHVERRKEKVNDILT